MFKNIATYMVVQVWFYVIAIRFISLFYLFSCMSISVLPPKNFLCKL